MEDNYKEELDSIYPEVDFKLISKNIRRHTYKYLGEGSGRAVFDLGNGYVVKAAKNVRGIAQNEAEYKISLEDNSNLFAKVLQTSEKCTFLIMEKASRIHDISFVWRYFKVKSNRELYEIKELQDISKNYDLELRDFGRAVNWGKIDGKPVIIDFGFTREVRRKLYTSIASMIFNRGR